MVMILNIDWDLRVNLKSKDLVCIKDWLSTICEFETAILVKVNLNNLQIVLIIFPYCEIEVISNPSKHIQLAIVRYAPFFILKQWAKIILTFNVMEEYLIVDLEDQTRSGLTLLVYSFHHEYLMWIFEEFLWVFWGNLNHFVLFLWPISII